MRAKDILSLPNSNQIFIDFVRFAAHELDLKSIPEIKLLTTPISNSPYNSFAAYQPGQEVVILYATHRHILDVLRSLCHEIVHYKQDLAGQLNNMSGKTGSNEENEANAVAGQILRKYGKMHPELF